jgi:UTP--glucose-1-phosphate uridylyltransferase
VKGVIVAAGYGSRFLPVTRVVPKELLPLVDRPALAWVVDEFVEAGVTDLLVITSRRKRAIEDWFDRDPELEALFPAARLARPALRTTFVRQDQMRGTGHALLQAKTFAGDDPILVAFPDDLFGAPNVSKALVDAWRATPHTTLLAAEITGDVSRYGVLDFGGGAGSGPVRAVRDLVEKPAKGTEPSQVVSFGRYLYTPEVFPILEEGLARHANGEFYATHALSELGKRGRLQAAITPAVRWDTGDRLGYLQAVVDAALGHAELGAPFQAWLRDRLR